MKTRTQLKSWTAVIAVLAMLLGLAACGDDDKDDGGASSAAPNGPAPEAGAEGAPTGTAPTETDEGPDGGPDENIVGGTVVEDVTAYPWVVALRRPDETQNLCGGALVGSRTVVTAAHCVTLRETTTLVSPESLEVVLGRGDLSDESQGQEVRVSRVWVAKAYDPVEISNDYAVLELVSDVPQTPIEMALVSQTDLWPVGQDTLALGWGCEFGNPPGPECSERPELSPLKAAWLDMQTRATCVEYYGTFPSSALCMKSPDDSMGTCQGDSGGPWAVYDRSGKPYLVGVTSFNALTGECSSDLPQAAAFVPFVVNDQRWFKDGIWNQCAGAAPCPVT